MWMHVPTCLHIAYSNVLLWIVCHSLFSRECILCPINYAFVNAWAYSNVLIIDPILMQRWQSLLMETDGLVICLGCIRWIFVQLYQRSTHCTLLNVYITVPSMNAIVLVKSANRTVRDLSYSWFPSKTWRLSAFNCSSTVMRNMSRVAPVSSLEVKVPLW